jgi:hypothetical protein
MSGGTLDGTVGCGPDGVACSRVALLYLSSEEITNWATPRAVRLGSSPGHPELRWAELEDVGEGACHVVLAPRYEGDSLGHRLDPPVIVNIFLAPDGVEPGGPVELDALRHEAIGTLYATREEAEATFARVSGV